MQKNDNIETYRHSINMIFNDAELRNSVVASVSLQEVMKNIQPFDEYDRPVSEAGATVRVSQDPSFAAAMKTPAHERVAVLNFASWHFPGGGVEYGANAQEEALCRKSTLHPCLLDEAMEEGFYGPHRGVRDPLYNDDLIYTPDVVVFKSDDDECKVLPREKWRRVDIVTMAAPNVAAASPERLDKVDLDALYRRRIGKVMKAAYSHRVGTLVLGAFGCGVFGNDPERVANATCDMIERYGKYFRHIEIPVYCGRNVSGRTNYDIFAEVFTGRFGKDVIENADVPKNRTQRTGREDRGRGGR